MKYIKKFEIKIKMNENINDFLLSAIIGQNISKVKELINAGADVNFVYQDGDTPLINAMLYNGDNIIKLLIESGADINVKDDEDSTPLINAGLNRWMKRVKMLIEFGADWNIKNDIDKDFLDYLSDNQKKNIIREYPNEYKEYLLMKVAKKYNL